MNETCDQYYATSILEDACEELWSLFAGRVFLTAIRMGQASELALEYISESYHQDSLPTGITEAEVAEDFALYVRFAEESA